MFFERKYRFDRIVGCVLLVLASPLILCLIAIIKMTSRGPGLYRQTRTGLDGKPFEIVKLRSMVNDAEKSGKAVWCVKNDCRVTWLGRILRKSHLDELPQLWNVACGDMSLVGPRPERPSICTELATQIDRYYDRNRVKPGVTGLAQINLPPDESVDDVRLKQVLDIRYIAEANAWLDVRMLMATAMRMFGVKGEVVIRAMGLSRRELLQQVQGEIFADIAKDPVTTVDHDWDDDSTDLAENEVATESKHRSPAFVYASTDAIGAGSDNFQSRRPR